MKKSRRRRNNNMELDKSRIYTAVNADELKIGSKCVFADSPWELHAKVRDSQYDKLAEIRDSQYDKLAEIRTNKNTFRFVNTRGCVYPLAYLVEEPAKLKWTDLKVGDVIRSKDGNSTAMVTRIEIGDKSGWEMHVYAGEWFADEDLAKWEKVEE